MLLKGLMEILKPKDPENLTELEQKHWPQIEAIKPRIGVTFAIKVRVGKIPHPMLDEHLIVSIEAFYGNRPLGKKLLKPGDEPVAEFSVNSKDEQKIRVQAYCNIHGLWENEITPVYR